MYAIILSALIYLGAFIYPNYLYLGMFIWMLPILITDIDNRYGFKAGFVWGLLFFGGHLVWLAVTVYNEGRGNGRMILYFAAVAYFSLFSGFWLWLKQFLEFRLVSNIKNFNRKCVASCCTWVISTVTFICLTCYCSLAIFGCFDGYPFINPLLPLVSWTWYIRPISYFGTIPYLILIVVINLSIANLYKRCTINSLMFVLLIISSPAAFSIFNKKINVKENINKHEIFYLQPTWSGVALNELCPDKNAMSLTSAQTFYEIARQLDVVAIHSPKVKFIVIPESGFAYNLMDFENKLDAWTSMFDDVTIFVGAHRASQPSPKATADAAHKATAVAAPIKGASRANEQEKIFNSLYQISNGKIINWYDKTHLVPFVERIPYWVRWIPILKDVFTTHEHTFSYPEHDQSELVMAGFRPCICSELFLNKNRPVNNKPILFICNDSWLALDYAKDLAKRSAMLYSMQHNVPIVYVGSYDWDIIN